MICQKDGIHHPGGGNGDSKIRKISGWAPQEPNSGGRPCTTATEDECEPLVVDGHKIRLCNRQQERVVQFLPDCILHVI